MLRIFQPWILFVLRDSYIDVRVRLILWYPCQRRRIFNKQGARNRCRSRGFEVVGKLDVTEETSMLMETMDVNGFQIPSSQVRN